jgi:hypothetical protein
LSHNQAQASTLLGCGSNNPFIGFAESAVTVKTMKVERLDSCQVRNGRLVIELESLLIREYPHFGTQPKGEGQRPLLAMTLDAPGAEPASAESAVLVGPPGYQPGQQIQFFRGRRVLDRPLRNLQHYQLTLRVMENDSTVKPEWLRVVDETKAIASAGALVGVNVPGAVIADTAWFLTQLDPDDLILLFGVELDAVTKHLGSLGDHRTLRLSGVTPRGLDGDTTKPPTAELTLLAFLEPEAECPSPAARAAQP